MGKFCRKAYNSDYYHRNRNKILARRGGGTKGTTEDFARKTLKRSRLKTPEFETSNPIRLKSTRRQTFQTFQTFHRLISTCWFERFEPIKTSLILLVISTTYFLLREAVEFYISNNASVEKSVFAAVLVELLLIAMAIIQPSHLGWKIASKIVLVLLFAYSSWTFTSKALEHGYGDIARINTMDKQIARLTEQVEEKNRLFRENIELGRLTAARRDSLEREAVGKELLLAEDHRLQKGNVSPYSALMNTWSMVILRLLLQVSNLLIVHYLKGKRNNPTQDSQPAPTLSSGARLRLVPS